MKHFIKYNLIGLVNTGITLAVVWVLHQVLSMEVVVANFLGYVAGGVNSYVWNRIWNFKSQNRHHEEIVRFLIVFGVSYFLNLGVLLGMETLLAPDHLFAWFAEALALWCKPGFIAHVVANGVYVVASFGMYKAWVFRHRPQ